MSIRTLNNLGDAFYDASTNTAYAICEDQPSPGQVDFAPSTADVYDIRDEHGLTPAEVAVARYVTVGKQPEFTVTEAHVGEKPALFTAPYTGKCFIWGDIFSSWITNRMGTTSNYISPGDWSDATAFTSSEGTVWYPTDAPDEYDVGKTIYFACRPDVWPQ